MGRGYFLRLLACLFRQALLVSASAIVGEFASFFFLGSGFPLLVVQAVIIGMFGSLWVLLAARGAPGLDEGGGGCAQKRGEQLMSSTEPSACVGPSTAPALA